MKKCLFVAVLATVLLCSCGESDTTVIRENIPTTVSKLAKNNTFDTLTVIKEEEYMHIYEKGDYKSSIPLKHEDHGGLIIAGVIIGLMVCLILGAIFTD